MNRQIHPNLMYFKNRKPIMVIGLLVCCSFLVWFASTTSCNVHVSYFSILVSFCGTTFSQPVNHYLIDGFMPVTTDYGTCDLCPLTYSPYIHLTRHHQTGWPNWISLWSLLDGVHAQTHPCSKLHIHTWVIQTQIHLYTTFIVDGTWNCWLTVHKLLNFPDCSTN